MRSKIALGVVMATLGLVVTTTSASAYCAYVTVGGNGVQVCTP